jgi:hypothetical protein
VLDAPVPVVPVSVPVLSVAPVPEGPLELPPMPVVPVLVLELEQAVTATMKPANRPERTYRRMERA